MLHLLRRQFFDVYAYFDYSLVLAYAFPKEILQPLLPPALRVDTYNNELGFVAVALVKVKKIRPGFMPEFLGSDLFLAGYRIFVRYDNPPHKQRRGLYILRSFTDNWPMVVKGNLFTNYRYGHCRLEEEQDEWIKTISLRSRSGKADLSIKANIHPEHKALPPGSPFPDLRTARLFEGPMPYTFSYERQSQSYIIVHGRRTQWHPRPIDIIQSDVGFFEHSPFDQVKPVLANAFIVEGIPYEWKRALREAVVKPALVPKPA